MGIKRYEILSNTGSYPMYKSWIDVNLDKNGYWCVYEDIVLAEQKQMVCKWVQNPQFRDECFKTDYMDCRGIYHSKSIKDTFKFCPYCGGKIEFVEE